MGGGGWKVERFYSRPLYAARIGRLRVVSFCSLESVEKTQKSSGEAASELARDCWPGRMRF